MTEERYNEAIKDLTQALAIDENASSVARMTELSLSLKVSCFLFLSLHCNSLLDDYRGLGSAIAFAPSGKDHNAAINILNKAAGHSVFKAKSLLSNSRIVMFAPTVIGTPI
ncbi:hypothetical protein Cylst_4019 [Cylindrospermum stagnale PCC 7417]|uniref:Uncharacterized protein n=1 Tax=Cylindrospermum stagnale PCC 7417 TaxID=56107 RepID=K9X238_9NOST|nr:hypothetical protein [Cylindrospermum stagnale]AFZ26129.1 hypothetical protein Cylst_4019 [Cylindrospermum stagnale PCC 7417]